MSTTRTSATRSSDGDLGKNALTNEDVESQESSDMMSSITGETTNEGSIEPEAISQSKEVHNKETTVDGKREEGDVKQPLKKKAKVSKELQSLTEWGDWYAEMATKRRPTKSLAQQMEEERIREEERAEKKRKASAERRRKAQEEERRRKEKEEHERKEREKRRRKEQEERQRQLKEKKRLKEAAKRKKQAQGKRSTKRSPSFSDGLETPEINDSALLEQRATAVKEPEYTLVDGYVPFIPLWRDDKELRIRPNFFVDEVYNNSVDTIYSLPFKTVGEVIEETSKRYKNYYGLEPKTIDVQNPIYPKLLEGYYLKESHEEFYLDPLEEIGRLMELFSFNYIPESHKLILYNPNDPWNSIVGRYSKAIQERKYRAMFKAFEDFNDLIKDLQKDNQIVNHLQSKKTFSRLSIHEFLNQIYSRAVSPQVSILKKYRAFSNTVYGELLPKFLSKVFDQVGLKENHVFIDLGSGVGNVTFQAALEYGCESYGCEIMENCSKLADLQHKVFKERCKLYGIKPGKTGFFNYTSFIGNQEVLSVIKRSNVILVNNFLFTPQLNKETLQLFLELQVGTKIISLKKIIPEARYHDFDDDFLSMFLVEKHEFGSGCVSWTDAGGVYYITTFTGEVSEERKRQLTKAHNTRRGESEFLKRSSARLESLTPPGTSAIAVTDDVKNEVNAEVEDDEKKEPNVPIASEVIAATTQAATA